jgi:protein gp37
MATDTKIEWADKTWSPIIGCDRVSPGCDSCYAITTARIREHNPHPSIAAAFAGTTHRTAERLDWTGKLNLLENRLTQPLTWRKPAKVFVNSLSDLFHKAVPDEFIARVFAVMALTPQHTYQILTKRHGRMRSLLGDPKFEQQVDRQLLAVPAFSNPKLIRRSWPLPKPGWPLPNVWLGVSVEDQKRADLRIPALLDTPAVVRFLSCEPLLGPVDLDGPIVPGRGRPKLTYWLTGRPTPGPERITSTGLTMHSPAIVTGPRIDWVIVGGESGHGARPMSPDWARTLRDQCTAANVPFLFKQWGEYAPTGYMAIGARPKGCVFVGDPIDDLGHRWEMRRVGKKAAGRELDGRTWDEFPDQDGARDA